MKSLQKLALLLLFTLTFSITSKAQNAEKIVDTYIETVGGLDAWNKIKTMKIKGVGKEGGTDYPFTAIYTNKGESIIFVDIQGTNFIYEAFDGETLWAMSMQSMKPEAQDSETSANHKKTAQDYLPDSLMNYKAKGYKVEFAGNETFDGTECYKIKLTKQPMLIDGKQVADIEMYYFDTENNVPIAVETKIVSGEGKGATFQRLFSDYQEVGDVILAFTTIEKYNGQTGMELHYKNVDLNTEVDSKIFKMKTYEASSKN